LVIPAKLTLSIYWVQEDEKVFIHVGRTVSQKIVSSAKSRTGAFTQTDVSLPEITPGLFP